MEEKPNLILFRDKLLHVSEGFVLSQGEALRDFTTYYFGSRAVNGLNVPRDRSFILNRGGLRGGFAEALFKFYGMAPAFSHAMGRLNPVLIHAHFGVDGAYILPVATSLEVPLVVTFHGFDATIDDEYARKAYHGLRLYLRRRDELCRRASLFIAVSEFIKSKLVQKGFPEEKVLVHYLGVDTDFFRPDAAIAREPLVLFVGRLSSEKGCEHLLEAMAAVRATAPNVGLAVIGDGPLRQRLEHLSAQLGCRCTFLGMRNHEVVRHWMNRACVFCVPSVTTDTGQAEAFGLVFAESQAMGLPVVSFPTGGIPEAVAHGRTGFLADEFHPKQLSRYISLLLTDKDLWQSFSVAGRKRVTEEFNLRKQTEKLEEIYRGLSEDRLARK